MSVLTAKKRKQLPAGAFAGPGRSYPVNDREHAGNAKARAKQQLDAGHITKAEYERIVAAADRVLGAKK